MNSPTLIWLFISAIWFGCTEMSSALHDMSV